MDTPIVFQALPKWDSPYASTSLTIAKGLSKDRLVFYVEHPFSWFDYLRNPTKPIITKRKETTMETPFLDFPNLRIVYPPFVPPINSWPYSHFYRMINKLYVKHLWQFMDEILDSFLVDDFIYINSFDPIFGAIQTSKRCILSVYHSVDWIGGESYIARHGVREEQKLASTSDVVITTSQPLADYLKSWNSNTLCIPNAADFDHFSKPLPQPEEWKSIPGKKAVYVGNIGLRLDYELLFKAAESQNDVQFLLIGPVDERYFAGDKLKSLPNVHFLGAKPYSELPAYMQHADVLLIPFELSELTRHIYPLKINEYLASGKPVVSTAFTDLSEFESVIHIAQTAEDFGAAIHQAIEHPVLSQINSGLELASQNTWNHRLHSWNQLLKSAKTIRLSA